MTSHDAPLQATQSTAAAIAEAASRWDARLRAPTCSAADRAAFAAWRDADPAHRHAFERLQGLLSTLRTGRDQLALREMRDGALALAKRRDQRRMRLAWAAGMAAATLAGAWLALPQAWRDNAREWASHPAEMLSRPGLQQYYTGIGQRSTITLADGSVLELNAMTRLEVAFEPSRREVRLHQGQAIFRVARQPHRPFVVQAGGREIVAVGTAFDVRVDEALLKVTLIEGKVGVLDTAAAATAAPSPPPDPSHRQAPGAAQGNQVFLTAGEQFVANLKKLPLADRSTPGVRTVDVDKIIGWREGQLFFEDMSLTDAVAEMNKYSAVRIELADPALARLRVNGMFRTGQQHAFARAVEDYFHVVAITEGEQRILLRSR